MFTDPALVFRCRIPIGWCVDAESSLLRTVFRPWDRRDERLILTVLAPAQPPLASNEQWARALGALLPPQHTERMTLASGPAVTAHTTGPAGQRLRRIVIRCGPLDVVADHEARGAGPSDIPLSLLRLAESVRAPARVINADIEHEELARAAAAVAALNTDSDAVTIFAAYERLERAAEERWIRCLLGHDWTRGLEAIDALVTARLTLGQSPHRLVTLADAHAILMRAVPFERATPPRIETGDTFAAALAERLKRRFAPVRHALQRRTDIEAYRNVDPAAWASDSFLQRLTGTLITEQVRAAFQAGQTPRPAGAYTGLLALLSAIGMYSARDQQPNPESGLGEDLLIIGHSLTAYVEAAGHFNDLDTVIESSAYLTSLGQRLFDLAPMQAGDDAALYRSQGAMYAATGISKQIKALVQAADQPSLQRALDLSEDAYTWLSKAPNAPVDRANVAQQEALAALQLGDVARARRALRRGRTAAEHVANRNQLRVFDWMSSVARALDGTPEILRSLPELEFVVMVKEPGEHAALRAVCATLERELAEDPTGPRTIELLILAARLLDREGISQEWRDACVELRAAAVALLDANRVLMMETRDLQLGSDDSFMARELTASIVRDELDRGDIRSALAAADGARGRILLADLTWRRGSSILLRDGIDGKDNPGMSRLMDKVLRDSAIKGLRPLPPWDGPLPALRATGWLRQLGKDVRAWANALTEPLGGGALTGEEVAAAVHGHGEPVLLLHPIEETLTLFLALANGDVHASTSPASTSEILGLLNTLQADIGAWVNARQQGEQEGVAGRDAASLPYRQAARKLYELLVAPVTDHLAGHARLTVVPYRELSSLPFGLLEDESGALLFERFAISTAPSIASLRILERAPADPTNVARACVVGAPLTSQDLEPLAGAARETELLRALVASVHPEAAILCRTGAEATPAHYALDARGAQLVHLACHAGVGNVSGAALYLAPDADGHSTLDASNIARVPLDRAMVFLAACRSGGGPATADGSMGAAREFLRAGARAVIASHWKVSDDVATRVAAEFYERFFRADGHTPARDVASALQSAMLATRDELSRAKGCIDSTLHAGWWAPFFVLGCGTVTDPLASHQAGAASAPA
jgi:CHAT domain-containing protein